MDTDTQRKLPRKYRIYLLTRGVIVIVDADAFSKLGVVLELLLFKQ